MKLHPDIVAAVLDRSDERDCYLQRILNAERAGYARGRAEGYEEGWLACVAELKAAQQETYELIRDSAPAWGNVARHMPAAAR